MRRSAAAVLCLALAAGCTADEERPSRNAISSDGETESAAPSPSSTPSPAGTLEPEDDCAGLGRVPSRGQITYFENNELRAEAASGHDVKCLLRGKWRNGNVTPPLWNARANRVLLGDRALSRDGSLTMQLTDGGAERPQWSRPSGTSVVYLSPEGALMKRSSYGGEAIDISFVGRHDAVTYHPAGKHIASSGRAEDGSYGLYLATNLGTEPQLLARGEAARFISNLHFSEDGLYLYFTARHDPRDWHLHRLGIGEEAKLETLAVERTDFDYAVSPFDSKVFAVFVPGDCASGENGSFQVRGSALSVTAELGSRNIHPVGWLPNERLVARVSATGCSTAQPGDVYVLSENHQPRLIQQENYGNVSVRVQMPPPPPPPGEEQEVVA